MPEREKSRQDKECNKKIYRMFARRIETAKNPNAFRSYLAVVLFIFYKIA